MELKRTFLYQAHLDHGGKLVDFSGWSLPIHYGSQIREHLAVRHGVGIFDVSHMTIIDCKGPMVRDFCAEYWQMMWGLWQLTMLYTAFY